MFNRENIKVRPLSEELEGIGLDPDRVMDDIERNSGLLEQHAGSPPSSEAVRPLYEEDLGGGGDNGGSDGDDIEIVLGEGVNSIDEGLVEWDGDDLQEGEEIEYLGEKLVKVKKGYRMKDVGGKKKLVKITKSEKRKEKRQRMKKRGKLRTAARMYAKRFKTKIKKRRARLKKKGSAGKGRMWRNENVAVAAQLQQLREELEASDVNTGEVTPFEEAAINAGWLALLLGECFEAMGDTEVGEMLYRMSDTAAGLSEEIEAAGGEMSEALEGKLTSLLEGVTKALATHEEIGSPSLFESIQMGVENGLYEDEDDDDENDHINEDGDDGDNGDDGDDSDDGIDFDDDE